MYSRSRKKKEKKTKHLYLFQYKLLYRCKTGTNHHGLLPTSIWCFKDKSSFVEHFFMWWCVQAIKKPCFAISIVSSDTSGHQGCICFCTIQATSFSCLSHCSVLFLCRVLSLYTWHPKSQHISGINFYLINAWNFWIYLFL